MEDTTLNLLERHWTGYLTTIVLPTDQQIQQLERVRERLQLGHETFAELIQFSPASLRRVCQHVQAALRVHHPDAPLPQLLKLVFSAILLAIKLENTPVQVDYRPMAFQKQLSEYLPGVDRHLGSVMSHVQNLDDLVEFMLSIPEFAAYAPDPKRRNYDEINRILGWPSDGNEFGRPSDQFAGPEPAWLCEMPPSVRPNNRTVRELEELRRETQIPHRVFASLVLQSPGTTRLLFERQFEDFQRRRPDATERELFDSIIQFRYFTTDIADGMVPRDARELLRQPWRRLIINSVVEEIKTIDDLVRYIVDEYEEFWKHTSDPFGVNTQIAEILGYRR